MSVRSSSLVVSFALLVGTASVVSQQSSSVTVAVSVTARSADAPVRGLTAADFRIVEDGVERPVESVSEGPGAVSVAVVVDSRDTTAGVRQELAQRAVERLVSTLKPDDEISVVTYEGKIVVAVPWTSVDRFPRLEWSRWKTMPFSELLQGVYQAIGTINQAKNARTAVLAISDAEQIASKYALKDFIKSRRESETSVYGLRTADLLSGSAAIGGPRPGAPHSTVRIWDSRGAAISFDDLVRDSGGRTVPGRTTIEIDRSVDALVSELRHRYVLTFRSPTPFDNTYRRLKVELRKAPHKVRHALGYLAKVE